MSGFSGYLGALTEWNATSVIPAKVQLSDGNIADVNFSATTPLKDVATFAFQASGAEPEKWGKMTLLLSADASDASVQKPQLTVAVNDNCGEALVSYDVELCYDKSIGEFFGKVSDFKKVSITAVKAFEPELDCVQVNAPNPRHTIHEIFGRDILSFSIDPFEAEPEEVPEVKIIVKSNSFDHHYVLETFLERTVLDIKLFVIAPKFGDNSEWDELDEREKMVQASILKVFDKDGKQLEDLKTWAQVMPFPYPNFFVVSVEAIKSADDVETLSEFGLHLLNTQVFHSASKHGDIYDGMNLNLKPNKGFKGALTICANRVKFYYHYGVDDKIADVYDCLEDLGLMFRGVQAVFKLRLGKSGSFLMAHEPLFANFLTGADVEIVASLNGGAPKSKGVAKSIYKGKVVKKKDIYHSTAVELIEKVKAMKFADEACLNAQALLAHLVNYTKCPKALFEDAFEQMGADDIKTIQDIMSSNSRDIRGGAELKLEGVANVIVGKMLKGVQNHISECETLYKAIVAHIIDLYASFAMKTDRFDNSQIVKMLDARATVLKASGSASDDKSLAEAFAKFNIGS